ncbi:hypothetical protein CMV_020721 [Castanea mollissima]|uniref:Uncharacterized protein n=1 Tax=Castanea mollissima TaxID=60419 RepID=A0A8J4QML6_9ROSI|nr:hypothetical protein CMV_020721 [Castanea mollissima]
MNGQQCPQVMIFKEHLGPVYSPKEIPLLLYQSQNQKAVAVKHKEVAVKQLGDSTKAAEETIAEQVELKSSKQSEQEQPSGTQASSCQVKKMKLLHKRQVNETCT